MPITTSSLPSNRYVEASDPIINSISALKQLLQQQKQNQSNTLKDKGSEVPVGELASPSRSQDVSIDTLRKKLVDAERIITNERALRTTLEKAFEDLSQHRKLLQEQFNQLQQQVENQSNRALDISSQAATTLTSSEADGNAETDCEKVVKEAQTLFQEQQLSWEKERDELNKTIQYLKEEANKDKNDAESKLLEQNVSYLSEIQSLQRQLESLREEFSSLQSRYQLNVQEKAAESSPALVSGESVKETTLLEFEGLKREHDAILIMLKNVSSDGAPEADKKDSSNSDKDALKASHLNESEIVGKVRGLISQLRECEARTSTLEISLSDAKKETENLEHALAKAESHTPDSTTGVDDATHDTNDDDHLDMEIHSIEKSEHQNLKEEVRKLRGALKDAIGEASRSQRILSSLETRLHDKKLLTTYCQKLNNEKHELLKISHAKIIIDGETESISTVQLSETITEGREKSGTPSDINIQLYETRELLEQNKKLVTFLQLKIQKFESDIGAKDSQIESLQQELRLIKQEHSGPVETAYSMSRDEDQDDDEEEDDQDDEVEEKESEEGENSGQEVEVIDVNDDSEEDLSNQQNEDDEIDAASGNVVEESDADEETEQPHSKKQRLEENKDGNDSASADV